MFDMMEADTAIDMPGINLIQTSVTEQEKGTREKEMVGIYFTHNPFELLAGKIDENTVSCSEISESYQEKRSA